MLATMGRTASLKVPPVVLSPWLRSCRCSVLKRPAVSLGKKGGRGLRIAHKGMGRPHTHLHRHHSTLARASAATSPAKTVVSAPLLSGLPGIKKGAAAESQLLRLHQEGRDIILEGGMPLLEGLSEQAFVNSVSEDSLVLGFESLGGATSMIDIAVGQLACKRFLAGARNKLWWMVPEWGTAASQLTPETQFLLVELREGGPYAVLLPLIDNNTFRATLRGMNQSRKAQRDGPLMIRIESGDTTVLGSRWGNALYLAAGWDPFQLVDRGIAAAAALSGTAKPRMEKSLPASLDVFGWCTWDAFYSRVSARGLHEGMASLVQGGVPPRFLIIDDGWQCTDVDPPLRQPLSELPLPKNVKERVQETLTATKEEFVEAELEMLYMGSRGIPAGSSLGAALQAVAADDDHVNLEHHMKKPVSPDEEELDRLLPWRKEKKQRREARDAASQSILASTTMTLPDGAVGRSGDASLDDGENGSAQPSTSLRDSARPGPSQSSGGNGSGRAPPEGGNGAGKLVGGAAKSTENGRSGLNGSASAAPQAVSGEGKLEPKERVEERVAEPVMEHRMNIIMWLLSAVAQRAVGLAYGLGQILVVKFYQYVVEPAPHDSWPVRLFAQLASGPFRQALLEFYATSGDFSRRLTSIEANSKFSSPFATPDDFFSGAPPRLDLVVQSLRDAYGVQYVYCWHGLSAYWSGVAPASHSVQAAKYESRIVYSEPSDSLKEIEPSMSWNPSVVSGIGVVQNVRELYFDMHAYLSQAGITGVKVDCQAGVGLVGSTLGGGPFVSAQYQTALEDSIAHHFPGNHAINCMCHSTENLYRMRDTAVARVSDDFYPRDPASSSPHIAACAYNSMFLGALLQPDWDMFHSHHHAAQLHAAARAVSGGAVYVSDYPGKHDFEILRQLVLSDGSVFRGLLPGRPTRDTLFHDTLRDGRTLLKVWNINAHTGVVGVFNLQGSAWDRARRQFVTHNPKPPTLTANVRPADIEIFNPMGGSSQQSIAPLGFAAMVEGSDHVHRLRHADEGVPVSVQGATAKVVTIAPVTSLKGVEVAALGLSNMFNGGGAITSFVMEPASARPGKDGQDNGTKTSGVMARIGTKGVGDLLLYCSVKPLSCTADGGSLPFDYDEAEGRLKLTLPDGARIERKLRLLF